MRWHACWLLTISKGVHSISSIDKTMYTQNTPVHIRLWNKDFWLLAIANLLLGIAVNIQMVMAFFITSTPDKASKAMGVFGIGMVMLGVFTSYLVERYRRNHVCLYAILGVLACLSFPLFHNLSPDEMIWLRLVTGVCYGLAEMVLYSTLVVDTCESHQRTEANYAVTWFGRFSLALGPFFALLSVRFLDVHSAAWMSVGTSLFAFLMVMLVGCPFRSPVDNIKLVSLDRFFLPASWGLVVNLFLVSIVFGMMVSMEIESLTFFALLMVGFLLAIVAEKYVFVNAELMSEAISGMLMVAFALLVMLVDVEQASSTVPILLGLGSGIIASRFLLFFIKLSDHCQRGTSQSSFFLAWEMGMALGLFMGMGGRVPTVIPFVGELPSWKMVVVIALMLDVAALLMYVAFTHQWYMKHKNR